MSQGPSAIVVAEVADMLEVLVVPELRLVVALPEEVGLPVPLIEADVIDEPLAVVDPPPPPPPPPFVAVPLWEPVLSPPPVLSAVVLEPPPPPLPASSGPAEKEPHAIAAAPTDKATGSSERS
jgi:hypothetical protein